MAYAQSITDGSTIRVTAGYPSYSDGSAHRGIDTVHTDLMAYAPASGTVIVAQTWNGSTTGNQSWGNCIRVQMADGRVWLAAHFASQIHYVGETITKGDFIGVQGATGNATGNHTHWELWSSSAGGLNDPSSLIGIPNAVGTYDVTWDASTDPGGGGTTTDPTPDPTTVLALNPPAGTYITDELVVTITGIEGDGKVWLTGDGTDPTSSETRFLYTGPIRYWDGTHIIWVYDTNSGQTIGPYTYVIIDPNAAKKFPVWLLFQFDN